MRNKKTHEIILKFLNQHKELLIEARSFIKRDNEAKNYHDYDSIKDPSTLMFKSFDDLCTNLFKILRKFCQGNIINKK